MTSQKNLILTPSLSRIRKLTSLATLLAATFFVSLEAQAVELTLRGAASFPSESYSFIKSPSAQGSVDLTFGMFDLMQFGVTYDHNWITYTGGGNGTVNFLGGLFRAKSFMGIFADVQAGECTRDGSSNSFSFGVGAGYSTPLTYMVDWGLRVGYRSLPDNSAARTLLDAGIQITFRLL